MSTGFKTFPDREKQFRGRLRNTFLSVLLPISILLILIISGVTYLLARKAIQSQINSQLTANINRVAVDFDKWTTTKSIRLDNTIRNEGFRANLEEFLASPGTSGESWQIQHDQILEKISESKTARGQLLFNHFFLVETDGNILASTNEEWENLNISSAEFFLNLSQERGTQVFYNPIPIYPDEVAIVTSVPYLDNQGKWLATIFGVSGSLSIQGNLSEITNSNPNLQAYIITENRDFIGLDRYQKILTQLPPSDEQFQILPSQKETYIFGEAETPSNITTLTSFDGNPSITAYTWLPQLRAGLVVEVPEEIAFGELNSLGPIIFFISIALGALVLAIILITTHRLVQPLRELTIVTEKFSQGNWDQRANLTRNDEVGRLAFTFNELAADLSELYRSLEAQVFERTSTLEKRTRQLEATAQVAREAAAIRNLDELLTYSSELISEHFEYYHTGIFLIDNARRYAVLQAANSEGGQRMLARNHKLEVGQTGVVGYVAATGLPRIALDVGEDANYFNNPDLPLTRSEIALPLQIRNRVIGVLDVQSLEQAAFTSQDVEVLQVLADQISLAIENARLLEQSQDAIKEMQSTQMAQMRRGWRNLLKDNVVAYHYNRIRVIPATEAQVEKLDEIDSALAQISATEGQHILSVPIMLRGAELGVLVLHRDEGETPWSQNDLNLVSDSLSQVAIALDNARLLEETLKRADQEQTISEISTQLSRSIDVDSLLRTAVRELAKLPNVTDASIHIGPQDK